MTYSQPPQLDRGEHEKLLLDLARLHPFALACDENGRVAWMTRSLEELETVVSSGSPCAELVPELADLAPTPGVRHLDEATLRLRSGARPISATRLSLPTAVGDPTCQLIILRLAEEGPHREAELLPGAHLLEAILHNAPDAVIALDRSGFITYANSAVERLTRFTRGGLLDRPAFLLAARNPELLGVVSQLGAGGDLHCDLECEGADGHARSLSVSSQALILGDGEPAGQVVFLRDVTERQQILEQLAAKNAELENYVNTVSHDLRSPLVSLLGFSHLLRKDYEKVLDGMGHHFLDRIDQAAHTMESLTDDLLSLSKIGQVPIQREFLEVGPVLSQLRAELKPRLEARGARLVLPKEPHRVYSDPTRLYQLFSNLIGNALLHMGEAPGAEIRVELRRQGEADLLCVCDNGIGIAAKHHERIFRPFQSIVRSDGTPTTGMGLAIVQKIASVHGGRAWVESRPGNGSTFIVSLSRR